MKLMFAVLDGEAVDSLAEESGRHGSVIGEVSLATVHHQGVTESRAQVAVDVSTDAFVHWGSGQVPLSRHD
jgi:hypothetical protein